MDHDLDVLEVQRSEHDGADIHTFPEQPSVLTVEDLSLLRLEDVEVAREIVRQYTSLTIPRENVEFFKQHLFQRNDSWFVKVGEVGLVYLTNIVPTFTANLQVMFWDKRFGKNRRELVRNILATAFEEFALTRVGAFVPVTNRPLAEVELRKIGFVQEGVLRGAWREKEDCDLVVFGLLRDEAKLWGTISHLQTSVEVG